MAADRRSAARWAVPVAAALLLWPAVWNRYPIVFADTGTYLSQAVHWYAGWDRPVFYSLFMLPLHATLTVWPVVVAQALLAGWVMWVVCRVLIPGISGAAFVVGVGLLAGCTWLPWIVSELMPDVFTPLLVLVLCLLGWVPERLAGWERVVLVGLAAFMIASQLSSLPLAVVLVGGIVGAGAVVRHGFLPRRKGEDHGRGTEAGPSRALAGGLGRAGYATVRVGGGLNGGGLGGDGLAAGWLDGRGADGGAFGGGAFGGGGLGGHGLSGGGSGGAGSGGACSGGACSGGACSGGGGFAGTGTGIFLAGRAWLLVLPPVMAVVALCAVNLAAHGRFAISPFGNVFLLARVIYDGPGSAALRRDCQLRHWRLCPFLGAFPPTSDDFLWAPDSPLQRAGGAQVIAAEAEEIIGTALVAEPGRMAWAAFGNTLTQLGRFASGDGLRPWPEEVSGWIARDFPAREAAAYAAARQQLGVLSVPVPLAWAHWVVGLGGVVACVILLPVALRRGAGCAGFLLVVLLALPVSAAITGALSAPHNRYQSRIMWLPPFVAVVALGSVRRRVG